MADSVFSDKVQQELMENVIKIVMQTTTQLVAENANKRWFRQKEAADYCSCSVNSLIDWTRQGLKVSLVNGIKLYDRVELDKWILKYQQ